MNYDFLNCHIIKFLFDTYKTVQRFTS